MADDRRARAFLADIVDGHHLDLEFLNGAIEGQYQCFGECVAAALDTDQQTFPTILRILAAGESSRNGQVNRIRN